MKYRRKPKVYDVEAEQWFPGKVMDGVSEEIDPFLKISVGVVRSHIHGVVTKAVSGDYIVSRSAHDRYAISKKNFERMFEPLSDENE